MNVSKSTPGPWRVLIVYDTVKNEQRATVCTPYNYAKSKNGEDESEIHIADCGVPDQTALANARLIASAPDLLAAVRETVKAARCNCTSVRKVVADGVCDHCRHAELLARIDGQQ